MKGIYRAGEDQLSALSARCLEPLGKGAGSSTAACPAATPPPVPTQAPWLCAQAPRGLRAASWRPSTRLAVRPRPPPRPSYFVCSGEAGPGLVGPAVIVLSIGHLHVIAEADEDLPFSQLFHCGPLAELRDGEMDVVSL